MTIKSDWVQLWKKECPNAFRPTLKGRTQCAFIDGQIKLMKSRQVTTWREFIFRQFASSIKSYFAQGMNTVVLAFDDYGNVPASKNMTQTKRRRHVPKAEWNPNMTLPVFMPEDWDVKIMNRTFKTKVIQLIIETLPKLIVLIGEQRLIIDYQGHPIHYTASSEPFEDENMAPMGEADVKFTRYCAYGDLLVEATDGDYLPIALMHIENSLYTGNKEPNIFIHRMQSNPKRTAVSEQLDPNKRREYEYVDMNKLYSYLSTKLRYISTRQWQAPDLSCSGHEMKMLCVLITLTACDFTKGLAQVGPKRIWDDIDKVWINMLQVFQPSCGELDIVAGADILVSRLYCMLYAKHVSHSKMRITDALYALKQTSSLSQRIKDQLPTYASVICSLKNANWVLQYWKCTPEFPNPLSDKYGYTRNKNGLPIWADDA
jgi:hypothetical protein